MAYDIYIKEEKIRTPAGEQVVKIRPLTGGMLPKLYKVIKKFPKDGDERSPEELPKEELAERLDKFFNMMDEEMVLDVHAICLATLKASDPDVDEKVLDLFASQNMMQLLPAIIEVNMRVNGD